MIDIHCHLLPAIDDGARDWSQSLQMAQVAANDGITDMVLTPHVFDGVYENPLSSYLSLVDTFRSILAKNEVALTLHVAGEVHLSEHIADLLAKNELPFLGQYNGEQVILLELPHGGVPVGAEKMVQWLRDQKIRPIIAHPERNKEFMRSPERMHPFIRMGCGFQVTAGSLIGGFGDKAQERAWQIVEQGWCLAVASDAHNLTARPPKLSGAYQAVAQRCGTEMAHNLFVANPHTLLS